MTLNSQEKSYQYYLEADISSYEGEWIALSEDKIIAHGKSLKEVVSKANNIAKGKKYLLARVPSQEAMIF